MTVLKTSGTDGDFVRQGQTLAVKEGFKFVSKTWYNTTIPIADGIAKITADADKREDIMVKFSDINPRFDCEGKLVIELADGREYAPTDHALRQYLNRIHVPYTYVGGVLNNQHYDADDEDRDTLLNVLNNGHRHVEAKKKYRLRTYQDGTLRAVLSQDYSPVDNRWYLERLNQLIPDGRLSHWRGDADTLYGNLLIPDTIREEQDSDYGGMVSMSNCEIGRRVFNQYPSVFRAICMNGCIWGRNTGIGIKRRHRGIDLVELATQIKDNINSQIPLMGQLVDKFLELQKIEIVKEVKISRVFGVIGLDYEFSHTEAAAVLEQYAQFEKGSRSAFGVVNAITRAGQLFGNDEWVNFDRIGGELAGWKPEHWNRVIERAKVFDDELMEKVFGVAV